MHTNTNKIYVYTLILCMRTCMYKAFTSASQVSAFVVLLLPTVGIYNLRD